MPITLPLKTNAPPPLWENLKGKPYITVSSKGLANGLSNIINDGADFGPDTPGTLTCGIQEAINFADEQTVIQLLPGNYYLQTSISITKNVNIQGTVMNIMNLGPISFTPDEYSLYNCNIIPGNFPAFIVSSINQWTYLSLTGITITGLSSLTATNNIGIYSDTQTGSYGLSVGLFGCRLTGLYNCVVISNVYMVFTALNTTFDSFMNSAIIQTGGELNLLWSHIDNCDLTTSANSVPSVVLGSSTNKIQKVQIFNSIFESVATAIQINNINGNFHAVGCHIYNDIAGYGIDIEGPVGEGFTLIGTTFWAGSNVPMYFGVNLNNARIIGCYGTPSSTGIAIAPGVNLTGVKFEDCGGNLRIPITPSLSANPPLSGTVYQNTNPYDIQIYLPVYASTYGTAGTVTIALGTTSTPQTIVTKFVNGSTSSTATELTELVVPAGYYYEFTFNGVTSSTATVLVM